MKYISDKRLKTWGDRRVTLLQFLEDICTDVDEFLQELREAREVLRFYGSQETWRARPSFIAEEGSVLEGIEVFPIAAIQSDKGARAREYLEKIGEGK